MHRSISRRLAPIAAIAAFVLATPTHAQAPAQTEEGAVVTVVKKFFDGMRTRDTTLMRSTVAPNAVLRSAGGPTGIGDASTVDAFIERIGSGTGPGNDEQIENPKVQIDGQLASLWAYFTLVRGGMTTINHCGIDEFLLGKGPDGWKVFFISDTHRTEGCTPIAGTSAAAAVAAMANPKDVASQDAILAALYDVISGPAGKKREWDRFRSLFVPGARLIPTGVGPDGKTRIRTMSPDEYATATGSRLEQSGFFEKEIARTAETYGNVTQAFSTYESRHAAADEKPFARGINSIQLYYDGTRWWVVTIYWDSERPGNEIPARFLKKP
jgi:hypothetical protein